MFGPTIVAEFQKGEKPIKLELGVVKEESKAKKLFADWLADNRVRQFLGHTYPATESSETEWFSKTVSDESSVIWFVYVGGKLIGDIGLHRIDRESGKAELGIAIGDKKYWGLGIAPVIEAVVVAWAFENLVPQGLHKVWARAYGKNNRSIRALEKAGFREIGKFSEHRWKNGCFYDEWLCEAMKSEWQKNQDNIFASLGIKSFDLYPGCEKD